MTKETVAAIIEITDVLAILGIPYDDLINQMTASGHAATATMIECATMDYHGDWD